MSGIYLAGPFFNEEQNQTVDFIETVMEVNGLDYFSPRDEGIINSSKTSDREDFAKTIFESNIKHMKEAPLMLVCADFKDTGTIFEHGFMYGYGNAMASLAIQPSPIVTYSLNGLPANVMLSHSSNGHIKSEEMLESFIHSLSFCGKNLINAIDANGSCLNFHFDTQGTSE